LGGRMNVLIAAVCVVGAFAFVWFVVDLIGYQQQKSMDGY
jgi:hypothetical protein